MNSKILFTKWILPSVFLLLFPIAGYSQLSVDGVSGTWSNIQNGTAIQGNGTDDIYWGASTQTTAEKSSFSFTAADPVIFPVTLGQTFDLGTFSTHNGVIPIGAGITAAKLNFDFKIDIMGTIENIPIAYNFTHYESPNFSGTCPSGSSTVCDDQSTILNNHSELFTYVVNGKTYDVTVLGFMTNGQPNSNFLVGENKNGSAVLEAVITSPSVGVPEPSTYLILGSTLAIMVFSLKTQLAPKS